MAVTISAEEIKGYRQVEPNHLSAPRDGGVYAQLPANDSIDMLEQGTFVHYDYQAGEVNLNGKGPVLMVYNEEKLYDPRHQMHRDWAQLKSEADHGIITPRCFRLSVGDLYTTNNLEDGSYSLGDVVKVESTTGRLTKDSAYGMSARPGMSVPSATYTLKGKPIAGECAKTAFNEGDFEKVKTGDTLVDTEETRWTVTGKTAEKVTVRAEVSTYASGAAGETLRLMVVKEYTLPDGQPAVKLQVIAE